MTEPTFRQPRAAKSKSAGPLRLVYVSLAVRPPLSAAELGALEASSRRRNAAAGITGLLVAQEPYFAAVMEGPSSRLLARMEVIATDPRHRFLRILREETLPERRFLNWRLFRLPTLGGGETVYPPAAGFILDLAERLGPSAVDDC